MNKVFILLFFCFFSKEASSQFVAVETPASNILYAGIENPMNTAAENTPCDSLIIKTTNGRLDGRGCNYVFTINLDSVIKKDIRSTTIDVYKKNGTKLAVSFFSIKKLPDPTACITFCDATQISKYRFRKSTFKDNDPKSPDVRAEIPFFEESRSVRYYFVIDSFHFSIFRNKSCLTNSILNKGNYFTSSTYQAFMVLQKDDKIVFDKIFATGNDGSKRQLKSFTITVTD